MKLSLPISCLALVLGLSACGQSEATREPVAPTVAALAADVAATRVAGRVEGAATGVAGVADSAATGVAGQAEGVATGVSGRVDAVATGAAGRAEGIATSVGGRVEGLVPGADPLAGTSWQWAQTQMNNDTLVTPDNAANYTVTFNADGTVSVKADCNNGAGTYSADAAATISIGPLATTRAMCPPESQSEVFLTQLQSVATYVMQDGNLYLDLPADAGTMQLTPLTSTQ